MGEKGNVVATAAGGSGLVGDALDTGAAVVHTTTDVVVDGAVGAATGVVSDRVRDRLDRGPKASGADDEPDGAPSA